MRRPLMTTRMLMAMIIITALSLALILQHQRAVRREIAMRVDYEERLSVALRDVRDLRMR